MKKIGAIDIGTNSMRLLIAEVEDDCIVKGYKEVRGTRMGENINKTKLLTTSAIERNIKALKEFYHIGKEEDVEHLFVIATSAVRDAQNKDIFIERAKEEIGVDVEVISGEREAELGFLGVMKGLEKRDENVLVIDIGGGSTEFVFGNESGIQYFKSVDVGAVRMTEKCITTDPILQSEKRYLEENIDEIIEDVVKNICTFKIDRVIGIGGTATTIAAVSKKLRVYDREKIHNTDISYADIKSVIHMFETKSLEERKKIDGLHPKRADIIIAGAVILDRILEKLNVDYIRISEYDNLEGVVFEKI